MQGDALRKLPVEKLEKIYEIMKRLTKMKIQIKILDKRIALPEYATPGSAAIDLRACIDDEIVITNGDQRLINTGIAIHIENPWYAAMILPRSGLGVSGLVLANTVGLIDSDYQGEIKVYLLNRKQVGTRPITINPLDRIAQLVIVPVVQAQFAVVTEFRDTSERGDKGFGSTGHV